MTDAADDYSRGLEHLATRPVRLKMLDSEAYPCATLACPGVVDEARACATLWPDPSTAPPILRLCPGCWRARVAQGVGFTLSDHVRKRAHLRLGTVPDDRWWARLARGLWLGKYARGDGLAHVVPCTSADGAGLTIEVVARVDEDSMQVHFVTLYVTHVECVRVVDSELERERLIERG